MRKQKLTAKQLSFIDAYTEVGTKAYNNATQSALMAGYCAKSVRSMGCQLLTKVNIKQELAKKQAKLRAKHVASRDERKQFWTEVQAETTNNMGDRLRASELLGKSEADFIERSINLNADIPTDPEEYKLWLRNELDRLEEAKEVAENYVKSSTALAKRY